MKKTEVKAYNMAKGGARSKDLPKQAIKLAKKKVDYATILIGANNLCDWKTSNQQQLDQFEKDVRTSINTLLESNRNIKIFLAPVPDMYNLWWINRNNNKCTKMWDTFNICSSILSSSLTDGQREEFKQRWEDLNRTLDWKLPDEKASTIAGLIIYESRNIPDIGQEFKFHEKRFRIHNRSGNKITSLRIWT